MVCDIEKNLNGSFAGGSVENSVDNNPKCVICLKDSKSRCSNCNQVYYCSVNHQKQDWKNHKQHCKPFLIKKNEKFGRHLIAGRNIKAGEIVLKEAPLISGPSQSTSPVCVGCMKGLNENEFLECTKCGWLVCQRECELMSEHLAECQLTVARGSKVKIQNFISPHPLYQCLLTVRCLLLKESNPKKWETFIQLESHENNRRGSQQWKNDYEHIANFIPKFFKCDQFTTDEIMKVIGILQINDQEIPLAEPPYIAVYDSASFIEHSCYPNLSKSFTKKGEIIFWAPKSIKKDTNLSICYSSVCCAIWGTSVRQQHLEKTTFFKCDCVRCKDITEFGTNYGALLCNKKDCKGLCLPVNWENTDAWKCNTCNKSMELTYVNDILDRAGKDLAAMERGNAEHCTKYINHYSKWLPKFHHFIAEAKIVLVQLIGAGGPEIFQSLTDNELTNKIQLCRELIDLYEKLTPSEARMLGLIYFELHAALAERGRRASSNEDTELCQCALEESLEIAEKSIFYLQHEPQILSEGQICKQAKVNCDSLKLVMTTNLNYPYIGEYNKKNIGSTF